MKQIQENSANPNKEIPSFEEAFSLLEDTAKTLERGNLPLAEAARLFEQGMDLVSICNQHLAKTQFKITQLRDAHLDTYDAPDLGKENDFAQG